MSAPGTLRNAGALAGAPAGAILLESSTVSLGWLRELRRAAEALGYALLDAPVTGSKQAAAAGQLVFLVGGEAALVERVRPVLEAMAVRVVHCGASASALSIKLVNNMLAAVQVAALGEGVVLAKRFGLSDELVSAVLSNGPVASVAVKGKLPLMLAHNYADTQFALRWMIKDLGYALQAADELGVPLPLVALARQFYRLAGNLGYEDADWAAVVESLRRA